MSQLRLPYLIVAHKLLGFMDPNVHANFSDVAEVLTNNILDLRRNNALSSMEGCMV